MSKATLLEDDQGDVANPLLKNFNADVQRQLGTADDEIEKLENYK